MKRLFQVMVLVVVLLCSLTPGLVRAESPEEEAAATAKDWMTLVDAGQYGESWAAAAPILQERTSREAWLKDFGVGHQKLGKILSREKRVAKYTQKIQDAPDGEYVVLQYATDFANKPRTIETVITEKGPDGRWRVAGYWIKSP